MSPLDRLVAGERALTASLDGGDVAGVEDATREVADALAEVRAAQVRDRATAQEALRLADEARATLNALIDVSGRDVDRLAQATGAAAAATYGRNARMLRG